MELLATRTCWCGRPCYRTRSLCREHVNERTRELYESGGRERMGYAKKPPPDICRTTKVCTACELEKPISDFHRRLRDGVHVAYAHICKSCDKAKSYAWRASNPKRWLAIALHCNKERRDRKRANGCGRLPRGAWGRIIAAFWNRCAYCLVPLGDAPTRDHVQPLSRGGAHDESNVIPACISCNASKQDKTLLEWLIARRGVQC